MRGTIRAFPVEYSCGSGATVRPARTRDDMKPIRALCRAALFAFLALVCLSLANVALKSYDNYPKFKPFFSGGSAEYDAYFFGASNALNGIYPMQLWRDHAITSYNFAWHKSTIALDYWLLRLAARRHKPKIVFVDIFGMDGEQKIDQNLYYAHGALDLFPLSAEKLRAVADLFGSSAERTEFVFPFYLYHSSWKTARADTMKAKAKTLLLADGLLPTKGGELRVGTAYPEHFNTAVRDFSAEETLSLRYAKKIVAYCKKNGIVPVFMLVPYPAQADMGEWKAFCVSALLQEGADFLDMADAVDFGTDKFDRFAHLNPSGAQKVTALVGAHIERTLGKPVAQKDGAVRAAWDADYAEYKRFYDGKITDEPLFSNTLTLLSNADYRAEILRSGSAPLSETEKKLIGRLGGRVSVSVQKDAGHDIEMKIFTAAPESAGTPLCEKAFDRRTILLR